MGNSSIYNSPQKEDDIGGDEMKPVLPVGHPKHITLEQFNSTYQIISSCDRLGFGTFSEVKRAQMICSDKKRKGEVAIKIIGIAAAETLISTGTVHKECALWASLDHPGLVPLVGVYTNISNAYCVMPLMTGGDLISRIRRDMDICAKLYSEPILRHLFKQLVEAVSYLHSRNIVHRDIKLDNILLRKPVADMGRAELLLADFGFATYQDNEGPLLYTFPGTISYSAPEVIQGRPYRGKLADVWSLGIVLYALAARTLPFIHDDQEELAEMVCNEPIPTLPGELSWPFKSLVWNMLTKKPQLRITLEAVRGDIWFSPDVVSPPPQKGRRSF